MNLLVKLGIQNQISADVFPINYYDCFALQEAFSNHSFHLSSFDFFASIVQQLVAVLQPPHMRHLIFSRAAF